jgi:outer membrane protein assembly factor BamB
MNCFVSRKRSVRDAVTNVVSLLLTIAPLLLLLAASSTSAQTSTTPSPADWTQFHRDNMQRWNPYETVLGVNNVGTLGLKWQNPLGTPSFDFFFESSPAVANGVMYVGSVEGVVYALNASTGAKLWSFATGGEVESSPAIANGVVYVGSDDGNVYALNASSGAKLWSVDINTNFPPSAFKMPSSPAVLNGVVYVGAGNNVCALNAGTGAKLWSVTNGDEYSSPAVVNEVVYIGSIDGNVYALNASTGAKLWSFDTGSAGEEGIFSSPAVANGVVYVGSNNGTVYALNASTGSKVWSYITKSNFQVYSSPAVANGVVYVDSVDGNVYALNASTGAQLWTFPSGGYSSPAVANGVVYVENDKLYALNTSTGAQLWSYATGAGQSSPAVVDGVVYISSLNQILAFGPGAPADLFLRIEPTPTTVHQGDLITYAFPVWNLGPGNGVQEVLNTQVPAGTTFDYIRISGTPGLGTCTTPPYQGTGQIVCHENAAMAPNTTWTVRLTVKVTAPTGTVITENAATMGDTTDPNLANNTATVSVKVQ